MRLTTSQEGQPGSVLEEYLVSGIQPFGEPSIHKVVSQSRPLLLPGNTYWLVASSPVPEEVRFGETILWMQNDIGVDATGFRLERINRGFWEAAPVTNALTLRVTATPIIGDFDGDGFVDVGDVNLLSTAIDVRSTDLRFDLSQDQSIDEKDLFHWIRVIKNTWTGDANLDGEFNSRDLVRVFVPGEYEDPLENNSGWDEGDWNGDQEFTTLDFVAAFQEGGYEQGSRPGIADVPEPTSVILTVVGFSYCAGRRRHVRKCIAPH
jgi:hypothetical protein